MSLPLLLAKFNLPPVNPYLVRRERLLNLLDEGVQHGHLLTLVCAPTGYGKTTLVSQWVHQHEGGKFPQVSFPGKSTWLTLDQWDNDLARFISYLVAALQQIQPGLGQGTLAALQSVRSSAPHVLATLLINDFSKLVDSSILVLEDYHTINTQSIHDFMSYLIDHQTQQIHLVIISRSDPPLPLARLRAHAQLTEIRQSDLALTNAETEEFLVQLMGLALSSEQLLDLERRTEGWAAGLHLAALSMRQSSNIPAFIQTFSGGHDYIADYLTGEVLELQDEMTKNFLLQTSILKQLSAPLCEAVTGQPGAARILKKLLADNIFLISLDYAGEWFRYHALFADLLRKRLEQTHKDLLVNLHYQAGGWYAQNRMFDQAIEHYLAGEDFDAAANLIGENVERILMHGQTSTFLRWLEAFPADHLHSHPVLVVYQGVAMLLLGRSPEKALSFLQEIASSSTKFRGEADTLQALYSVLKGKASEAIQISERALQELPAERAFLRILAADSLAMAHTLRGDLNSAALAFEKVVEAAQKAGNVIMRLIGLSNLAGLRYQQGQLRQASADYQQVLNISQEQFLEGSQPMSRALLGMGEIAREWNDLEGACKYLTEAAELFKQYIDIGLSVAFVSLARVYLSQGDWGKVQASLEMARQHSKASKTTKLDDELVEIMEARLWIAAGELDRAEQWARRRGLLDRAMEDLVALAERNATAFEVVQVEYLTLARLFLAQNEPNKALEILRIVLSHNEKRAQMRRVIEVLILQAIANQQQGADGPAMQVFTRALTLAEPEGYRRTFLDEGQPVARLLQQAIAAGQSTLYAKNLLAGLTMQGFPFPASVKKTGSVQALVEPLSERELEVLGLIAEGLTNQEIGGRLHISLSTVKGHTTNIYSKLGVNKRTQAVALAQSLDLID
ncbi:MAG TPA: LuxR C-terminal-related transcriptional regulator [Anaerolineales bacterium]|nr:LuxR C-terminal-related transcriptional regulator [Anaerolineales bacterium]